MKTKIETTYITDDGREFRSESEAKEHEAGMTERNRLRDEFVKAHPFKLNYGDIVRLHYTGGLYSVVYRTVTEFNHRDNLFENVYDLRRANDVDSDNEPVTEYIWERDGRTIEDQADFIFSAKQVEEILKPAEEALKRHGVKLHDVMRAVLGQDA